MYYWRVWFIVLFWSKPKYSKPSIYRSLVYLISDLPNTLNWLNCFCIYKTRFDQCGKKYNHSNLQAQGPVFLKWTTKAVQSDCRLGRVTHSQPQFEHISCHEQGLFINKSSGMHWLGGFKWDCASLVTWHIRVAVTVWAIPPLYPHFLLCHVFVFLNGVSLTNICAVHG